MLLQLPFFSAGTEAGALMWVKRRTGN